MTKWIASQWLISYATGVLLLVSTTAHADGEATRIEICKDYSHVAKQVMAERQQDIPMSEVLPETVDGLMNWANKYGFDNDVLKVEAAASGLVMAAFEESILPVDSYKAQMVTDFENTAFKECYEMEIE